MKAGELRAWRQKPCLPWRAVLETERAQATFKVRICCFFSDAELQHYIKGWEMNESLFFKRRTLTGVPLERFASKHLHKVKIPFTMFPDFENYIVGIK